MTTNFTRIIAAALATVTLASPVLAQDRWDWRGEDRKIILDGRGVDALLPELRRTQRGRAFVMRNFDANHDGLVSPREADAANRAFIEIAGDRRDGFDWESRGRGPVIVERDDRGGDRHGGWDRRAMRDYHFRQTRQGATLVLQDVLFQTGSAALRPGAIDRLRPLADYLQATPGVQVAIDGYTDSVGTGASNLSLSQRRAASVRAALGEMGVAPRRVRTAGHGEAGPVATNATAAGRQLNRRVEVTLIGQQARSFDYRD